MIEQVEVNGIRLKCLKNQQISCQSVMYKNVIMSCLHKTNSHKLNKQYYYSKFYVIITKIAYIEKMFYRIN